jgi:hypothetical protein
MCVVQELDGCGDYDFHDMVQYFQSFGAKVLLSFGGASMG